jgi:cysteine desulfurase family protein (TIGR01976 family)
MQKDDIRRQFPALDRGAAYFDAPGGTQVPRAVGDAMTDYLFHHNANTHWAYPTSEETDAILWSARESMAAFFNCSPREVAFGANMTTLTFHAARAAARTWSRGDEVIITELDHHGNVAPWRALERDFGIVVKRARMIRETAQIDYEHLASLVNAKTRLIAIGGASNAVGTINDLERVRAIARDAGALLYVDAVHLAPHELIDVARIGCDFLACSSYKFYGPHLGILFVREELMASLPWPRLDPAPNEPPEIAETGTQSHEAIAGIGATIEFIASIGGQAPSPVPMPEGQAGAPVLQGTPRERLVRSYEALHEEGQRYAAMLWDALSQLKRIRLYGPPPGQPRTPTIAFTVGGMTAEQVTRALVKDNLYTSHGDFYAATVIEVLGVEALVRAGCACYTTDDEVARLIEALSKL